MIAFEGFKLMILNWLRIPPGTSLRKEGSGNSSTDSLSFAKHNELINSMIDITTDDVCIGSTPFIIDSIGKTPSFLVKKMELFLSELNKISKWAATDILKNGFSVYSVFVTKQNNLVLNPILDDLRFFLTKDGKVVVYKRKEEGKVTSDDDYDIVTDILVFLNYNKDSLVKVLDDKYKKYLFEITPLPVQLKNVSEAATNLAITERSIVKYRKQLARIVRFVNVDIGVSQGDKQQEIVDTISSAVNADSLSLDPMSNPQDFDDTIPVVPNRKGVGKPELEQALPDFDISKLADLDYTLGRIYLAMRFPKTYADFSTTLDQTAASMIRGDVRYQRLVETARSLLENSVNRFLNDNEILAKYKFEVKLTKLPTPEDEDVVAALDSFEDFSSKVYQYIIGDSTTKNEAALKLSLLKDLLGDSSSFPQLQKWFDKFSIYIVNNFKSDEDEEPGDEEIPDMGSSDESSDLGSSSEELGPEEPGPEEVPGTGGTEEVDNNESSGFEDKTEFIEPQQ